MTDKIEFDSTTQAWFDSHKGIPTTVQQCPICGKYYKPMLGHGCEISSNIVKPKGTLGENIKHYMKINYYTQKELAIRAGCTESAISRYIKGEREPAVRILKNLAIALGVTVDELIESEDTK